MAIINIQKSKQLFCCETCNYDTYSKRDFLKHNHTLKHLRLNNTNIGNLLDNNSFHKKHEFKCICDKKYKHMSSLCKHKRDCVKVKCLVNENTENKDILYIIKQQKSENKEIKDLLIKQNKLMELMIKNNILLSSPPSQNEFQEELAIQKKELPLL